jgi:stearoyl-CoA desaturase (delta-9 desaturase)
MKNYFEITNGKVTLLYYFSFIGFVIALITIAPHYFVISLIIHILIISLFSGVTHRYFCHKAYTTNPFVAWFCSLITVMYGYASPIAWTAMHAAHHAFADTDKDPHIKGIAGLFTASYKFPPKRFLSESRWFVDKKHKILHNFSFLILVMWLSLLFLISPQLFLIVGLVPIFTLKFGDAMHRVFSHKGKSANNNWWLEYIVPMGGEWIHKEHHNDVRKIKFSNRWFELDTGFLIIKLLERI